MRYAVGVTLGSLSGFLIYLLAFMLFVSNVAAGRGVASVDAATDAEVVGAAMGAGLLSALTGGIANAMAFVCLLCFAVAYFFGREMGERNAPGTRRPGTRRCP